jgi:hypothetical protein
MKKSAKQLDKEIAEALHKRPAGHARKKKRKSPEEIRLGRLKTLRGIMEDVYGDEAWRDTDLDKLEGRFSVDDDLPDHEWLDSAQKQLEEQSVRPEHVGAPPPNVYAWNDAFISTYRMNIDQGMSREDAIDSARQNANDTVELWNSIHGDERVLVKADPKLYGDD